MGPRERVLPHARRPRGPRLLRRAQPGLHGRQVRRAAAPPSSGRAPATAPRSPHDPHDPPVGAPAHPRPRPRGRPAASRPTSSCSPTSRPNLLAGGNGLSVARSEAASRALLDDLRSDVGMEWVPQDMWFTYLQLDAAAGDLDYDLAASVDPNEQPSLTDAGIGPRDRGRRAHRPLGRRLALGDRRGGRPRHLPHPRAGPPAPADQRRLDGVAVERRRTGHLRAVAAIACHAGRNGRRCARRAARATRPRPRHRGHRHRAQPLRAEPRARHGGHPGALRGPQRRPDQPRADRRTGRGPRPPPPGHRGLPPTGPRRGLGPCPRARRSRSYTFDTPGHVLYACHLPGHLTYGMRGVVEVVAATS